MKGYRVRLRVIEEREVALPADSEEDTKERTKADRMRVR
jgi:hypothetical protein